MEATRRSLFSFCKSHLAWEKHEGQYEVDHSLKEGPDETEKSSVPANSSDL